MVMTMISIANAMRVVSQHKHTDGAGANAKICLCVSMKQVITLLYVLCRNLCCRLSWLIKPDAVQLCYAHARARKWHRATDINYAPMLTHALHNEACAQCYARVCALFQQCVLYSLVHDCHGASKPIRVSVPLQPVQGFSEAARLQLGGLQPSGAGVVEMVIRPAHSDG